MRAGRELHRVEREGVRFAQDDRISAIDAHTDLGDRRLTAWREGEGDRFGDRAEGRRVWREGQRRRQRGDRHIDGEEAGIAVGVGGGDGERHIAWLEDRRVDRHAVGRGGQADARLITEGEIDGGHVLIGGNAGSQGGQFADRHPGQSIEPDDGHRHRGAQRGERFTSAEAGCGTNAEGVFRAVERHVGAHGDDVLASQQCRQFAVDAVELIGCRRFVEAGIGARCELLQIRAIRAEAQADGIHGHTACERFEGSIIASDETASAEFCTIAEQDDHTARHGRLGSEAHRVIPRLIERRLTAQRDRVDGGEQRIFVGSERLHHTHGAAEDHQRHLVVVAHVLHEGAGCLFRQLEWRGRRVDAVHAAAHIQHQHGGKRDIVIRQVLHLGDAPARLRQPPGQGERTGIQPIDRLTERIVDVGSDDGFRKLCRVYPGDLDAQTAILEGEQRSGQRDQQYDQKQQRSLHDRTLQPASRVTGTARQN